MGRKKLSMSERIRNYYKTHPNAKPGEVAAALNVKTALVYAVRKYDEQKRVKVDVRVESPQPNNVSHVVPLPINIDSIHKPKFDMVNSPPHYTSGGIETIDFIAAKLTKEEFIGYLKGNALKYGSRIGKKDDPVTDIGKMVWYSLKLREVLAGEAAI